MEHDITHNNAEINEDDNKTKSPLILSCFEWIEALIPALIVILILFAAMFRVITVNGPSMLPNLKNGYKVLVSCIDKNFSRGDIVVIDKRGVKLNEVIIKRVIATEGQTVDIDFNTGMVSVNGVEIDESDYIENGITKNQYDLDFPQKVPKGHIFVLGDNREISDDSRSSDVGMIDERYIMGKYEFVLMPIAKFGK